MTLVFPPKAPAESRLFGFDLADDLADGETISTAPFTVAVDALEPFAANTAPLVASGSPTIAGTSVTQRFTGGTAGVTYRVICTATTNAGNILTPSGTVQVLAYVP